MIGVGTDGVVAFLGDHYGHRAAALDLPDVRHQLGVQRGRPLGRGHHDDHRQTVFDQGDRAVLELAGGKSLGVHVGQLFEFQRAFQRYRVAHMAPQEQHGRGLGEPIRQGGHRFYRREHPGHQVWHRFQLAVLALDLIGVLGTAGLRQRQADQVIRGDLRQERFR